VSGRELRYEPVGDVDGDSALDGRAGIDHFVMRGDEEIACVPDEETARLFAAAPKLLKAAKAVMPLLEDWHEDDGRVFPIWRDIQAVLREIEPPR
jgi:hypothetical protein